jgi:GntR family transcriptional regulator|uniref:GntR family transcriptional regulator n=1 Tax=Dictyoglomus turgidum TaxID=513050 RepID=A0A7C3SP80_9BACT
MKIEKTIDRDSKEKLYVQMYSIFLKKIEDGEWIAGTKIPTENELCNMYNVSKVTVREAIQELVREGFLKRQQGKGTFVTYSISYPGILMRSRITENIYGEGVKIEKEIVDRRVMKSSGEIKELFGEEEIHYVLLKKKVDGNVFTEESFIPFYVLPNLEHDELEKKSLFELIEEKGAKKIFKILQKFEVSKPLRPHDKILKLKDESHVLYSSRLMFSSDGTPVALVKHVSRKDNVLYLEFERIK